MKRDAFTLPLAFPGELIIDNPPEGEAFTLELRNTCAPDKNKQLSGLYSIGTGCPRQLSVVLCLRHKSVQVRPRQQLWARAQPLSTRLPRLRSHFPLRSRCSGSILRAKQQ